MLGIARLSAILLALSFLGLSTPAFALRCPDGIVAVGDHKVDVLDACGEPLSKDQVFENPGRVVDIGGEQVVQVLAVSIVVDEWIYEFSPQRFRQLLRFRNNRLVEVVVLDKPG
jgi:hypothetical protein